MIYFLGAGRFVKIGFTDNLKLRMSEIQVGCPYKMKLLAYCEGGFDEEYRFQDMAAYYRYRGEWFRLSGQLRDWLVKGRDLVFTLHHRDGYREYALKEEVDREDPWKEWCKQQGKPYEPLVWGPGPAITRVLDGIIQPAHSEP